LPGWTERVLRIAGVLVGAGLALVSAVWEAVLSPMYAHIGHATFRLPLAVVLAVVGNVTILLFTFYVTGRMAFALLPAVVWIAVIVMAGRRTSEGDLLITGTNWVGVLLVLLGSVSWAVAAYWLATRRAARRISRPL
jgi:hypothetical protein